MTATYKNLPRGTSVKARKFAKRILRPLERFLQLEASSGFVLLAATAVALIWANVHNSSYEFLWREYQLGFSLGGWHFQRNLEFWINDGLMTFFFFLIGLELRREFTQGELSQFKSATLPIVAAIGGMAAPALIYIYFNKGFPTVDGWGIPMGTDTAFALGILAILGKRVPAAARILLLASAVIDDVGAILVIALFYSSGVQYTGLLVGVVAIGTIWVMKNLGVRGWPYIVPGVVLWIGIYNAGIHPTLAGVVLGFMTPAVAGYTPAKLMELAGPHHQGLHRLSKETSPSTETMMGLLLSLRTIYREGLSFVDQLIHKLHAPVAFFVMPVFALANAGVILSGVELPADTQNVFFGVALGLLLGKPFGIFMASFLAIKTGFSRMPQGMRFRGILLVGMVSAIGFTMAIFISQLAFTEAAFGEASSRIQETSKLAILTASFIAAVVSLVIGFLRPKVHAPPSEEV
jgi:NhaA family Na+:H+ antiporter